MMQLYPKPRKERKSKSHLRWKVRYELVYGGDGGAYTSFWSGYYRTYIGARIAAWWHVHIASWGGTVYLKDQHEKS